MDSFIVAFNVVMPLFILIGLGYFIQRNGMVKQTTLKELNSLVFKIFLPVLLFNNMYHADLEEDIKPEILIYAIICIVLIFTILFFLVPLFEKERDKAATIIQGMYRSNFALFGIAVTESMYGNGNASITGILVAVIVPIFNVLAVCLFEIYRGDKINIKNICKGILTNPLIIGTVLGLGSRLLEVRFHDIIEETVITIGNLATPMALIVLGGMFEFKKLSINKIRLFWVIIVRLLIIPVLFVMLSIFLGYREKELFALYIMFGSPTAVASFSMASAMGGDGELAGQIVVLTTIMSLFSCVLGIFIMKFIGVI